MLGSSTITNCSTNQLHKKKKDIVGKTNCVNGVNKLQKEQEEQGVNEDVLKEQDEGGVNDKLKKMAATAKVKAGIANNLQKEEEEAYDNNRY